MSHNTMINLLILTAILSLFACSEARKDPCQLLSVSDIQSLDDTVTLAAWAGRGAERQENEVCMYYADDGNPRFMLFVWYDEEKDPRILVEKGASDNNSEIIDVPGVGSEAAAAFADDELKLLAVKSARGVVGIRARKPIRTGSAGFENVKRLAEKALINTELE